MKDRIVFEDRDILVVNKPAGLATESARVTEPDLQSMLKNYLAGDGGGDPPLFMVHRLDQPVEGLIVFAKTASAAAKLSAGTGVRKIYTAEVTGDIPKEEDTLTDYIVRDPQKHMARIVPKGQKNAKKAILHYSHLEGQYLKIELETGRFHQIRAQLAHAGMPILGDMKYGGEKAADPLFGRGRIALCASSLCFVHPGTGEWLVFEIKPSF